MKETELLRQVMQHMDSIAMGVDPVSGEMLSEGSVLRREDLTRCFQEISRMIRQELGCPEPEEREPEELSVLVTRISRPLGLAGNHSFLISAVKGWLRQEGYLVRWQSDDGSPRTYSGVVTPKGIAAGLSETGPDEKGSIGICGDARTVDLIWNSLDQILAWERLQWEPLLNSITAEWRAGIVCSAEAITLPPLVKQMNSRLPEELRRKFAVPRINCWMVRNGYLEYNYTWTRKRYRPTWEGKQIGLILDQKIIRWTPAAQQFLLDHLEMMVRDMASGDAFRTPVILEEIREMERVQVLLECSDQVQSTDETEMWISRALTSCGNARLPHGILFIWMRQAGYYDMRVPKGSVKKELFLTDLGRESGFGMRDGYVAIGRKAQQVVAEHLADIWAVYYKQESGE